MLRDALLDVRYAVRTLVKSPGFTLAAVLALALGIGANTAIFSVVNAVSLRPLPWKDAARLVRLWESAPQLGWPSFSTSIPNFIDWREQNHVFEGIAAWRGASFNLTGTAEAQKIDGGAATASFFMLLGVRPALGRTFLPEEERPGGNNRVVVIGHGLWKRVFGSDPEIVGRTMTLNGAGATVVGVLPEGFQWVGPSELIVPLVLDPQTSRGNHVLTVFGRLRAGATLEQAQVGMEAIAHGLAQQYPDSNGGWGVRLASFRDWIVGNEVRRALLVLAAAVGLVLLIACANVTNLLLARAAGRRREIAIRAALGAGRRHVVRMLLTESAVVALAGGALGLLLALWTVDLLRRLNPGTVPRIDEVSVDARVLVFTLALSLLTSVVFGLVPALQASRPDVNDALKEGSRGAGAGTSRQRARSVLVVSEVALSLMLLIGAGLLIQSFWRLLRIDPGFEPGGLVTMQINLPDGKYPSAREAESFYERLFERLAAVPGVKSVSAGSIVPFARGNTANQVTIEGRPPETDGTSPSADWRLVGPGYFRTMGIRVLKGREFDGHDRSDSMPVVIVSETMARRYWPDVDPIGRRIQPGGDSNWITVVGVAGDVTHRALNEPPAPLMYFCSYQENWNPMSLVVRTEADVSATASVVRGAIRSLDKDLPVSGISTIDNLRAESVAPRRFNMAMLAILAAVALALAAVGIYGVMSYSVTLRTHEIGVRMALGSRPGDVLRLVVGQAMRLTIVGVLIGLAAALAATRVMRTLLFGVSATDPATFLAVPVLLAGVALAACYLPARRATRVDPMIALRYE